MESNRPRTAKALRRSGLKRRKRLRPVSSRRAVQLREYNRLKEDWIRAHPVCEICRAQPTAQVHHRAGRIGNRLNSTEDWLGVCAECHDKIHAHGSWARQLGFLK